MLNFQCISVGEGGGSICIRAVGDWRGPYLHILQFTLAHRTQLNFIQTGVKLSRGEIKPHFWKYSKSIAKRRNIYLVKMGRNPSGPVWIISWFCSQKKMFLFFLTNLEGDRCMLYSVFCIIYFVFHSVFCILYSVWRRISSITFPAKSLASCSAPPSTTSTILHPLHRPQTSFLQHFVENIELKEQTNAKSEIFSNHIIRIW